MNKLCKVAAASLLASCLVGGSAGTALAATATQYWKAPDSSVSVTAGDGVDYLKTYGVRAGSAGGDYVGICNTNYDFNDGSATQNDQFLQTHSKVGSAYLNEDGTINGAAYLNSYYGANLAIWATSVNENPNPYYANLMYRLITGEDGNYAYATTWMSNVNAWGDSNNATSTNYATGEETIAGLEYSPEIILGANKTSNWTDFNPSSTNMGKAVAADEDYNPTFVNNDYTNVWAQVYTEVNLAQTADKLIKQSNGTLTVRYNNGSATASALAYEKAIRGNLLYVASKIDSGDVKKKTVAYLYAIDADGNAYFFTPQASGLTTGDGDDTTNCSGNGGGTSVETANDNYAANNSTINMGYMATLPFITTTYAGVDEAKYEKVDCVMAVESLYKNNPCIKVSDPTDLAGVDVVIYNSTTNTSLNGTSNGQNSSGINAESNTVLNDTVVANWLKSSDKTLIAGDDYGTSTKQPKPGIDEATENGAAPILYCQRNYTTDKNTRAAWGFSKVYPELYGNNVDATYGYWLNKVYHIKTASVASVAAYMQNKAGTVTYDEATAQLVEDAAQAGFDWWNTTGKNDAEWAGYAYYNGASRASYFSGKASSEEPKDTIGIFAPSDAWTAAMNASAVEANNKQLAELGQQVKDLTDQLANATTSAAANKDALDKANASIKDLQDQIAAANGKSEADQATIDEANKAIAALQQQLTVAGEQAKLAAVANVSKTYKAAKKSGKLAAKKTFKVSASGVTFAKASGNAKITVSKAGKVTVKKGLKKGTYKVKVKATAGSQTKTITIKVKVK